MKKRVNLLLHNFTYKMEVFSDLFNSHVLMDFCTNIILSKNV